MYIDSGCIINKNKKTNLIDIEIVKNTTNRFQYTNLFYQEKWNIQVFDYFNVKIIQIC